MPATAIIPMKENNRFQMRINSMRQKSNSICQQLSTGYATFLIHYAWAILAFSSLLAVGLTVYFRLFMHIRSFDQDDFRLPNGPSMQNARRLREIFGNDSELRVHQQLNLYSGLDIIMKRKGNPDEIDTNQTNMLNDDIIQEVGTKCTVKELFVCCS